MAFTDSFEYLKHPKSVFRTYICHQDYKEKYCSHNEGFNKNSLYGPNLVPKLVCGNAWIWPEMDEMARNVWNYWKWLEWLEKAGSGWK